MKADQEKYEMKTDQESVMVKKKSKFTRWVSSIYVPHLH